jgi:hypothetical protein
MPKSRDFLSPYADKTWQEICPNGDAVLAGVAAKWEASVEQWIPTMPTRLLAWERDGFNYSVGLIAKLGEQKFLRIYGATWKSMEDPEFLIRQTAQLEPLELQGPVYPDLLVPSLDYVRHQLGMGEQIFTRTSSGVHIVNSRLKKKDLPVIKF